MVIITPGQDKFLIDPFDSIPNQNELIINIHLDIKMFSSFLGADINYF